MKNALLLAAPLLLLSACAADVSVGPGGVRTSARMPGMSADTSVGPGGVQARAQAGPTQAQTSVDHRGARASASSPGSSAQACAGRAPCEEASRR